MTQPETPSRAATIGAMAIAGGAGLAWFVAAGGARTIDPWNLDWLGGGDWAQNVISWLFFRAEPWSWPLGSYEGFMWPLGGSVAVTDSIPLVAVATKLAAGTARTELQYLGPYLAFSFFMQGVAGSLLAGVATRSPVQRGLAGALFVTAPALLQRVGHVSLTTHWMLLLVLWLALRPASSETPRRSLAAAAILCGVLAGLHPYLVAMAVPLALAIAFRLGVLERAIPLPTAAAWSAAAVALPLAIFGVFGYFGTPGRARGYGYFTADLLTLVNPMGASALLPSFPVGPGQYEGYGYLGLGVLSLGFAALARTHARRGALRVPARARPAAVVCAALAIFALSPTVTIAGFKLVSFRSLLSPLDQVTSVLRSSGRFVWPLMYLLVLAAIALAVRAFPGRRATVAIAAAAVVQVADGFPLLTQPRFVDSAWRTIDPAWSLASGSYERIELHPAVLYDGDGPICAQDPAAARRWIAFAYRAWTIGATVNSGYLARVDRSAAQQACRAAATPLRPDRISPRVVHVVSASEAERLEATSPLTCGVLEGHHVCVPEDDRFAAALRRGRALGDRGHPRGPGDDAQ